MRRETRMRSAGWAFIGAAAGLCGAAALAQNAESPADAATQGVEQFYDAESWRALVSGKTLTYQVEWGVMGREWYDPGGDRVVYVYFDGRCYDGSWREKDGVFCFRYDGEHCFRHLMRDGKLIAREMDGDEQVVTKITDERLSCTPDYTS